MHRWAEVGRPPSPRRARRRWLGAVEHPVVTALLVGATAATGPYRRVARMHDLGAVGASTVMWVTAVTLAAGVGLIVLRHRSWVTRVAVVAAVSGIVGATGSTQLVFWVLSSSVLAGWAGGAPPLPVRSVPPRPTILGVALLAVASTTTVWFGWTAPIRFAVLGTLLVAALSARPDLPVVAGRLVGRGAQAVCFALLGVVAVVVPGVIRCVVPDLHLGGPSSEEGWRERSRTDAMSAHPWLRGDPAPSRAGRRAAGVAFALILAVAGVVVVVHRRGDRAHDRATASAPAPAGGGTGASSTAPTTVGASTSPTDQPAVSIPPAFADSPWYPQYAADAAYSSTWLNPFALAGYNKLSDGGIPGMSVVDGSRSTWQPPACSCPHVTLWLYGSATTYGYGQRDDHTVASDLAKLAWEDGIALEIVNRGVPGDPFWRAADRFAWDLTAGDPPDLVAFYSGVTDLNAAIWLDQRGLGDDDWPQDQMAVGFLEDPIIAKVLDEGLHGDREQPPLPAGMEPATPAREPARSAEGIGELAVERYQRSLPMGLDLAAKHGVDAFTFWEPMRLGRPPVAGEPTFDTDADLRVSVASASAHLPSSVIDLAHAFDGVDQPLYFDDVHYNELGAELAAKAMYEHLRPAIRARASSGATP